MEMSELLLNKSNITQHLPITELASEAVSISELLSRENSIKGLESISSGIVC
jgi:hypothetical protein